MNLVVATGLSTGDHIAPERLGAGFTVLLVVLVVAAWLVRRGLRGSPDRPASPVARAAVHGALLTAGGVAVVDNVVFHWLLAFHRFKDGWHGSIYVEVAGVLLGLVAVTIGYRGLRERTR